MSFPAYPEYKYSGADWLGDVPAKWEVVAYKRLVDIQNGADHKAVQQDDGYPVYGSGGVFTYASEFLFEGEAVLLGRKGTINKPLYVDGAFWTVDTMYWAKIRDGINGRFAYYAATTIPFAYYKTNTAVPSMTQTALGEHRVPRPPLGEQRAIAAFLDRETAKIDAAVAAQERLIALLAEKRAATISHAVTKGFDPEAPMKDSGIEWLGQIPAHWPVQKIGWKLDANPRYGVLVPDDDPDGVPMLRIKDLTAEVTDSDSLMKISAELSDQYPNTVVEEGDLLLSVVGTIGSTRIVGPELAGVNLSRAIARLRPSDAVYTPYLRWIFESLPFTQYVDLTCVGTAQRVLNMDDLSALRFAFPAIEEQRRISEALDRAVVKFDDLINRARQAVGLLKERRSALISAAVTGKIDVRGEVTADNVVSLDEYRAAVGAVAIAKLGKMGRMAVMKAGYLAEAYAGMHELQGRYERNAAGPYCSSVVTGMERGAADRHGIMVRESEGKASYDLPVSFEAPAAELRDRFGIDRANRFLSLMTELSGFSREGVEAVATLYAAWNDLFARDGDVTDDAVFREVLDNWHSEKREKFNTTSLSHWMDWMRRNGVVPDGTAPRTDHQAGLEF